MFKSKRSASESGLGEILHIRCGGWSLGVGVSILPNRSEQQSMGASGNRWMTFLIQEELETSLHARIYVTEGPSPPRSPSMDQCLSPPHELRQRGFDHRVHNTWRRPDLDKFEAGRLEEILPVGRSAYGSLISKEFRTAGGSGVLTLFRGQTGQHCKVGGSLIHSHRRSNDHFVDE